MGAPRRYGRPMGTRHEVHIIPADLPLGAAQVSPYDAFLAPGQSVTALVLPCGLSVGYANVHACGTRARDIVGGMRGAARFLLNHPPLRGAERVESRPRWGRTRLPQGPPGAPRRIGSGTDRDLARGEPSS
jgi:hypothetical protein